MSNQQEKSGVEMGSEVAVFQPSMVNLIAGYILSIVFSVGGIAFTGYFLRAAELANWDMPNYHEKEMSWTNVGLSIVFGVILLLVGIAFWYYTRTLVFCRVHLFSNGFRYATRDSVQDVLWRDVIGFQEITLYERAPILKGPAKLLIPRSASTSYVILTKAGKQFGFDGDSINDIERFGKFLREQSSRLAVPWEVIEKYA